MDSKDKGSLLLAELKRRVLVDDLITTLVARELTFEGQEKYTKETSLYKDLIKELNRDNTTRRKCK